MTIPPTGPQPPRTQHPGEWQPGTQQELPDPAMTSRGRRLLPIAVAVGILALVVIVVILVTSLSGGGSGDASDYGLDEAAIDQAPEVSELAGEAAAAADDVDIEAGLALMCQVPAADDVEALKGAISQANEMAGGEAKKSITITDATQDGDTGTFNVQVQGEGALQAYDFAAIVHVSKVGDDWCIDSIGPSD
ncbi:MAG: hypothetical protein ACK5MR_07945 [Cumulibacter sp.]